jgi:hypothetical protein
MKQHAAGILFSLAFIAFPIVRAEAQYGAPDPTQTSPDLPGDAQQLFLLTNQDRAQAGVRPVNWDPDLAQAALAHCRRMASEGPIAHRYAGEPDLTGRASQSGAHFSLIEENVAIGPSPEGVENEWMHSPGHRSNLLSPDIDRVGIAIVSARGVLYAVADYSHAVLALDRSQIEAQVASLLRPSGVEVLRDPSLARQACASDNGMPRASSGPQPRFVMRWQDSDLRRLPQPLTDHLRSGIYRWASVGSCAPQGAQAFTSYRLAVLLF